MCERYDCLGKKTLIIKLNGTFYVVACSDSDSVVTYERHARGAKSVHDRDSITVVCGYVLRFLVLKKRWFKESSSVITCATGDAAKKRQAASKWSRQVAALATATLGAAGVPLPCIEWSAS